MPEMDPTGQRPLRFFRFAHPDAVAAFAGPNASAKQFQQKIAQLNNAAQNGNVAPPAPATNSWTDFLKTVSSDSKLKESSGREPTTSV
jgi:hypothetical protein